MDARRSRRPGGEPGGLAPCAALRALGIEHRFATVVVSGEVGVAKPDPAVFGLVLGALGVGPERVWHVGDSLEADVAGARAAGLTAVWLNRARTPRPAGAPEPDHEISSLAQFTGLLPGGP